MAICLNGAVHAGLWVESEPGHSIHKGFDIPAERLHGETERYLGALFEERFKFYRIYHNRNTADLANRQQVVKGETHFTARPMTQYVHVVRIRITPDQEPWFRDNGIERQDAISARVRFAGIAPGGALAFDLLEVLKK